jgi:hypothetical protein
MLGFVIGLSLILLIIYGMVINLIIYVRINKIRAKSGEKTSWVFRELYILQAILTNEYKDDKLCNNLVWQIRVIIPLVLLLWLVSFVLQ